MATVLGLVPIVGALIYMLFRPPEYLEDVRERELEIKAMEERLARRELHCPVCRAHVEDTFLVCPVCTTKLRQACVNRAARDALADLPALARRRSRRRRRSSFRRPRDGSDPASSLSGPVALERTLVLVKPDAMRRALPVRSWPGSSAEASNFALRAC